MVPDDTERTCVVRFNQGAALIFAALLALPFTFPAQAQFLSEFSKHSHTDPFDYGEDVLKDVVTGCEKTAIQSVTECMRIFGPLPTQYAGERKSAIKVVFPYFVHWATAQPTTMLPDPVSLSYYCTGADSLTCTLVKISTPDPFPEFRCSSSRDAKCASAKTKFEKNRKRLHLSAREQGQQEYTAPCFTFCGPTPVEIAVLLSGDDVTFKDLPGMAQH